MATPVIWKGVAVAMQSAIGTAVVITSVTKANPAVVATAGAVPVVGNYVLMSVQGMSQIDGRIFRVIASGAGVFSLEGEDSTLYDTFTTGTFQLVTYGVSITSATTVTSGGGTPNFVPTTTIHANYPSSIPSLPAASDFAMDHIWDPTDAGQAAMRAAFSAQGTRAFKFTFGTGGRIMVFNGYVSATGLPAGTAQGLVTTPTAITLTQVPTYYAA